MGLPIIPGPNNELITQSLAVPPQYQILADYSDTASYALYAETCSVYITSMSYVQEASSSISSSYSETASISVSSSYSISASYAKTASYSISSSYATTASYAITSSHSVTSSYSINALKYWGSWYSTATQTASFANTAYPVTVNTLVGADTFYISGSNNISGSAIVIPRTSNYDFQFSLQLHNTGGGGANAVADIWLRVNGNSVSFSNTRVSTIANSPYVVAAWDFMGNYNAGDKIELMWATNHTGIQIESIASSPPAPEIPSVIFTIMEL